MGVSEFYQWLPLAVYVVLSLVAMYFLTRFKRERDPGRWVRRLHATIVLANKDEAFRTSQLAEVTQTLADFPQPSEVTPLQRKEEYLVVLAPRVAFLLGLAGTVLGILGVYDWCKAGYFSWLVTAGPLCFVFAAGLIFFTRDLRLLHRCIQHQNLKFLLEKAGGDHPAAVASLEKLLAYYPPSAELWLEMADQYARTNRLDDALRAVKKAGELSPGATDILFVELSFRIRKGDRFEAEKLLTELAGHKLQSTDPRLELYRSAQFLLGKDQPKALAHAKKGVELDHDFTEKFVDLDVTLAGVKGLLVENGLLSASAS